MLLRITYLSGRNDVNIAEKKCRISKLKMLIILSCRKKYPRIFGESHVSPVI